VARDEAAAGVADQDRAFDIKTAQMIGESIEVHA
jgi:hypothetical protein